MTAILGLIGTWIGSHVEALSGQGWGAYVLVGIGVAFVVSLSAALVTVVIRVWQGKPIIWTASPNPLEGLKIALPRVETKPPQPEIKPFVTGESFYSSYREDEDTFLRLYGRHTETGSKLTVCIDVSYRRLGFQWSEKRRIRIAEIQGFVKDEQFNAPLISRTGLDKKLHGWGDVEKAKENLINIDFNEPLRCRVAFINDRNEESFLSFFVVRAGTVLPMQLSVIEGGTFGDPAKWF